MLERQVLPLSHLSSQKFCYRQAQKVLFHVCLVFQNLCTFFLLPIYLAQNFSMTQQSLSNSWAQEI